MEKYEPPVYFGDWLKQRRKILDLTQRELSKRAGCSVFAVRKIEAGDRKPSKQLAALLANALEIPREIQQVFVRAARGEINLGRLPRPSLKPKSSPEEDFSLNSSQFPTYFNPLVGREAELAALARIFDDPQCRLLTLTGMGGIGKTRLAAEFATTQRSKFPGGVFFVPLAPINSPDLIVPAIADVLQLLFSGPSDPKEQLIKHIARHLKQPGLFILDNMEHLLVPTSSQSRKLEPTLLLVEMLHRLPLVKILVTSRERLNLQGEWTYELHGLPAPPPVFLEKFEYYSASILFLQNARRAKADFEITRDDLPALATICEKLEGIPLAIELAATWVTTLSCQEIADEIESNIDFLTTTTRDIPERHRSLRATFDHSWKLLGEEERNVLCQLSIFRGGFDREAAAQIANASLFHLASLVSKSLVRRTDDGRYDLHEVIRQFTLSCFLSEPYNRQVRDHHCQYYLTFVSDRESALKSALQQDALRELTFEIDNIRAAWTWAIERQNYSLIRKAIRSFCWFFETSGLLLEGIEQFELLVVALKDRKRNVEEEKALGQTLAQQSLLIFRKGQFNQAQKLLEKSLLLLRPFDEPALLTDALIFLGVICHLNGDVERSQRFIDEGLVCARASKDEWFTAYAVHNQGYIASLTGRYAEGYKRMMAGIALWRKIGDPHSISLGLNFLTPTLIKLGRFEEAENHIQESLSLSKLSRNRWGTGTAYRYLGLIKLAQGKYQEAQDLLHRSLEFFSGYTEGWDIAISLIYLGTTELELGNLQEAESFYRNALHTALAAKSVPLALEALVGLAKILAQKGEFHTAVQLATFVQNQSTSAQASKDAASQLLAEAEIQLPVDEVQTITAEAKNLSLETIVQVNLAALTRSTAV